MAGVSATSANSSPSPSSSSSLEESRRADPFTLELSLTFSDLAKTVLGTVLVLPRTALVILVLALAWLLAKVGTTGVNSEELNSRPLAGWRRTLSHLFSYLGLLLFWAGGFRVKLVGRQASREEAPLLVGAPHSSFLEAMLIIMCRCSPVSRHENKHIIVISVCQKLFQTIFVDRRSAHSRRGAAEVIRRRSQSTSPWPQIFIFPEGTNTNRRKLIRFKLGAFSPGVPVQPVILRYPGCERVDPVTWTFHQQHSYWASVWLLLARPLNHLEVEFLPVYRPNQEEVANAELYAKNVQKLMAKNLGIYASDDSYYDYYAEYCRNHGMDLKKD